MFGQEDPILIEVKELGCDPLVAETVDDLISVRSPGGVRSISLKETGPNTQVFRNDQEVGGQLQALYLAPENGYGQDGVDLRVDDEEVLEFEVKIQPYSVLGSYRDFYDVMVDRCEIGTEYQNDYGTYCPHMYNDAYSYGFSGELYDDIGPEWGDTEVEWFKNFLHGDLESEASNWIAGNDSLITDSVDIVAWTGHATKRQIGGFWHFFTDGAECDLLPREDTNLGDTDADWVIMHTCWSLEGSSSDLLADLVDTDKPARLFCGFTTLCWIEAGQGCFFAECLETMPIKQAWRSYVTAKQKYDTVGRVYGPSQCEDDSIGGGGPIWIGRSPTYSDYYYNSFIDDCAGTLP